MRRNTRCGRVVWGAAAAGVLAAAACGSGERGADQFSPISADGAGGRAADSAAAESSGAQSSSVGSASVSAAAEPAYIVEPQQWLCPECGPVVADHAVNPFVATVDDAVSTFALDVDTASYTLTRNFIDGGGWPPADAVRVEEFVNYFDAGYEIPTNEFSVVLGGAVSLFSPDRVLVRVGVQAPASAAGVSLPDSVVLVMDRSGSMTESSGYGPEPVRRIELAHTAVRLLLDGLPSDTRIAVVAYGASAEVVVQPRPIGNGDEIMSTVLSRVQPDGSTNAEAGLVHGFGVALEEAAEGHGVLVLLMSDGVANVGATRTDPILEEIGNRADISLSTVGVGLGPFNDFLMEQLANRADGTYHYIDTVAEAQKIFGEHLMSLLTVAARDAKIQIEFDPATVQQWRLVGYENRAVADEDFRDDTVDAGEVGVAQSATAFYEIIPTDRWRSSAAPAVVATLRYTGPDGAAVEVLTRLLPADATLTFNEAPARFRLGAVAAGFAELLRASPHADNLDLEALAAHASAVAAALPEDREAAELAALIREADRP